MDSDDLWNTSELPILASIAPLKEPLVPMLEVVMPPKLVSITHNCIVTFVGQAITTLLVFVLLAATIVSMVLQPLVYVPLLVNKDAILAIPMPFWLVLPIHLDPGVLLVPTSVEMVKLLLLPALPPTNKIVLCVTTTLS